MLKKFLHIIITLSITVHSYNSFSIEIPECQTIECNDYFKQYKIYSKSGYTAAMVTLGDLYFNGHGTDINVQKALKEYKSAAKYGSVTGQQKAAMIYLSNEEYKDVPKGVKYLEKAARGKSSEAAFLLGVIYYKEDFYERDFDKSDKWLTKAYQAEQKNAAAFIRYIDKSNNLNANNYPDLLDELSEKPLPVERDVNPSVATSTQQKPIEHSTNTDIEVITITSNLHEMFTAQIASLKKTYPEKGANTTGSRIIGRTCEKTDFCGIPSKADFERLIYQLM